MDLIQEKICINCPMGCRLTITSTDDGWNITGNQCNRGEAYAFKEMTNPTRVLTTTVRVEGGPIKRMPVRTREAIPKKELFRVMEILNDVVVRPPIKMGDIILANILNTGIDVIASRSIISKE